MEYEWIMNGLCWSTDRLYGPIHWIRLTMDGMLLEYVGKGIPWKITEISESNHGVCYNIHVLCWIMLENV